MIKKIVKRIMREYGYEIRRVAPLGTSRRTPGKAGRPSVDLTGQSPTTTRGPHKGTKADPKYLSEFSMIASKTYNPEHPDYDATVVKNYPGCFYDVSNPSERTERSRTNSILQSFLDKKLMTLCGPNPTDYDFLASHIRNVGLDLTHDSDYQNLVEKCTRLDEFIAYLNSTFLGQYFPGSVSTEDALFLYYVVRLLQPKTIVQTGVSNGLSTSYMCLALKASGQGGRLHAIDIPAKYSENDPVWHHAQAYGVVIPPDQESGWLVPDALHESFECWNGDAKDLLPKMLDQVGTVDLFYHDSDHTYDHVWFELTEVLPHMRDQGVIVIDDIAWTSAAWDFAAKEGCYAFNHRGSQGVLFL